MTARAAGIVVLLLCLLVTPAARADTYDTNTLVSITVSDEGQTLLLYDCHVDIVGRRGEVYKALLTEDQLRELWGKGLRIEILYDEMAQDRRLWKKETQIIRDLTETATTDHRPMRFNTSISFHGGEVCFNSVWNYTTAAPTDEPIFWSSRTGGPKGGATPAPDGLAKAFQDGCTTNGFWFTEGYDWYGTRGDTNDWAYGAWTDLDTTIEATANKTPPVAQIPIFVAEHRQATINYMLKTFQGIHGVMTDQDTGAPLDGTVLSAATASATIPVPHDYQAVFTDPVAGDFHRVLQPGTYTVICKAPGYVDTVVTGVVVAADAKTTCNCPMVGTTALYASASSFADLCSGTGSGGDGVLDPGEDATVLVTLANSGVRAATHVTGSLSTSVPGGPITDFGESFDGVTTPALPLGWPVSHTSGNDWVTAPGGSCPP